MTNISMYDQEELDRLIKETESKGTPDSPELTVAAMILNDVNNFLCELKEQSVRNRLEYLKTISNIDYYRDCGECDMLSGLDNIYSDISEILSGV